MKKNEKAIVRVSLALLIIFILTSFVSCNNKQLPNLWENATYTENTTLGSGSLKIVVKVEAGDKSIELTIMTDKTILGEALFENNIVEGENSAYGLYINAVNGIKADYETDGAYWAFYKNGEYAVSGVDTTNIADGEHYELVYTKG